MSSLIYLTLLTTSAHGSMIWLYLLIKWYDYSRNAGLMVGFADLKGLFQP